MLSARQNSFQIKGLKVFRNFNWNKLPDYITRFLLKVCIRLEGGEMTSLSLRSYLLQKRNIVVGDYKYGSLVNIGTADQKTTIGNCASFGPGVRRFGASYPIESACMHPFWYNPSFYFAFARDVERTECTIGHRTWIRANVIISPRCKNIGIGAVIGAGAVVTNDVPNSAVVSGNPARIVRFRLEPETRSMILNSGYWREEPSEAYRRLQEIGEKRGSVE